MRAQTVAPCSRLALRCSPPCDGAETHFDSAIHGLLYKLTQMGRGNVCSSFRMSRKFWTAKDFVRMEINFRLHDGRSTEQVGAERIRELASLYGLDRLVAGRYSSLFVLNLYTLERVSGVSPEQVVAEIEYLEGLGPTLQTKEAAEFKGSILKGLWHKHFMPALPSSLAHNITNHLGKDGLEKLIYEVFDPENKPVVTKEMIHELSQRVVVGSLMERGAARKLTGEWIIFAKECEQNYYLSIAPHTSGDQNISTNLALCKREFPFLSKYVP